MKDYTRNSVPSDFVAEANDFQTAVAFLCEKRDQTKGRPLPGTRTRLLWANEEHTAIGVRYHDTFVLTWTDDGRTILNSGGWRTMTTKKKINAYLPKPWQLYAEKGVWWLAKGWRHDTNHLLFADGLTIEADGSVTGAGTVEDLKDTRDERKAIQKYIRNYMAALVANELNMPSGGDCWYCYMQREADGKPLGDMLGHHLRSHIEESYFVPSLLWNAMEAMGASSLMLTWAASHMNAEESWCQWDSKMSELLGSMLTRYMYRELGHSS